MFFRLFFLTGGSSQRITASTFFLLAFKLSKNSRKLPSFHVLRSSRLRVQKYYIFPYLQQLFYLFFEVFRFTLTVSEINSHHFQKIDAGTWFHGKKCGFLGFPKGNFRCTSQRFRSVYARFRRKSARIPRISRRFLADETETALRHSVDYTLYIMREDGLPAGSLPCTPATYMVTEVASY